MSVIHAPIRINVNIAGGKKTPSKTLNVVNCSEIWGTYKMFYQQSFSHNLVSFRRAYQCYCQPCKKGTFLLKRALFLITLKVRGTCPQWPPSYAPGSRFILLYNFKVSFSELFCASSDKVQSVNIQINSIIL